MRAPAGVKVGEVGTVRGPAGGSLTWVPARVSFRLPAACAAAVPRRAGTRGLVMALWEIALAVLALAGAAVAGFTIPLLMRLRRTAEHADNLMREAELHVGPALAEVQEMTRHLNKVSAEVADGVSRVGRTFEAVGELGKTLQGANALLRTALGPTIVMVGGLIAGVRAAARVLRRQIFRRR